jgi:hypothetical protein
VPTNNNPRLQPHLLRQHPEHLVVHNASAKTSEKAFALSGVSLIEIQGDDTSEKAVTSEFTLLVVSLLKR